MTSLWVPSPRPFRIVVGVSNALPYLVLLSSGFIALLDWEDDSPRSELEQVSRSGPCQNPPISRWHVSFLCAPSTNPVPLPESFFWHLQPALPCMGQVSGRNYVSDQ